MPLAPQVGGVFWITDHWRPTVHPQVVGDVVAQIFNLPYHQDCILPGVGEPSCAQNCQRAADCISAIRLSATLRYKGRVTDTLWMHRATVL